MGIMDRAAVLAADQRDADHEKAVQRQAAERQQQADRLARKWGVPATYGGTLDLLVSEWRGRDRTRVVTRERRDTYLLAGEIRVAFLRYSGGSSSELRLIQSCDRHGQNGSVALYPRSSGPQEPGEEMLIAAVAASLREAHRSCPACMAERENATCPTCGHDMSDPRDAQ